MIRNLFLALIIVSPNLFATAYGGCYGAASWTERAEAERKAKEKFDLNCESERKKCVSQGKKFSIGPVLRHPVGVSCPFNGQTYYCVFRATTKCS